MKTAYIFGGSGYIGTNLINYLVENNVFEKIYVFDIRCTKYLEKILKENNQVSYLKYDVREKFNLEISNNIDKNVSWIFNFAAIHREPGHDFKEYFDTNIPGAENVVEFAKRYNIKNIFFTSSIAPYGRSLKQRDETSNIYPETAYGISKLVAEKIHSIWLSEQEGRRLIIVRPSVIFGPGDPGNVYRMIRHIKNGTFILPNGGNVIKAYGYIYGLIDSIIFNINKKDKLIIYNYSENPLISLKEMVKVTKKFLNINKPTFSISVKLLVFISFSLQIVFKILGKKNDLHPTRVKKASFPTNIKPKYLIDNGFKFKYDYLNALKHWKKVSPEELK